MEVGDHYRAQREELSALALSLSDQQLGRPVPGCPKWVVRDLLAHLVGLPVDVRTGTMDGAGSPSWTQAQVEARRGRSVAQLLAEWTSEAPAFEQSLAGLGFRGWVFVYDITMHGDDLREALGIPLGTSETHSLVLDGIIDRARSRAERLGTLTLRAGDRTWSLGEGPESATLTVADTGELGRVMGGRRSDDAVRALAWTGDPEPWLPVLPLFREGR